MRAGLEVEAPALFVDDLCTTNCGMGPGPILPPPPPPPNNGCPASTKYNSKYGTCYCGSSGSCGCPNTCDNVNYSQCNSGAWGDGYGPTDACCINCLGTVCRMCGQCCTDSCFVTYTGSGGAKWGAQPCGPADCNCPPPPSPA